MTENKEDSKTVQDFLAEQAKVNNKVETTQRRLREAYDNAQRGLNEENVDRLDKLSDKATRKQFQKALISGLLKPMQKTMETLSEEDDPEEAGNTLLYGMYGFTTDQVNGLVEGAKEELTFEGYIKNLTDPQTTEFKKRMQLKSQSAYRLMNDVPNQKVVDFAGTNVNDPSKLTLEDKIRMVEHREQEKRQPYMK